MNVDTGATLHASGAITINAKGRLDVGAHASAAVYASGGSADQWRDSGAGLRRDRRLYCVHRRGGTLDLTGLTAAHVSGANGTVNLTQSHIWLTGGGFTVSYLGASGNLARLFDTGADDDVVYAANGTLHLKNAAATLSGDGNTVVFFGDGDKVKLVNSTGPSGNWISGSNGEVDLESGFAAVLGGGNTIRLTGTDDLVRLRNNPGDAADTVYADGQRINFFGAHAEVIGGGDAIYFVGTGNVVTLKDTNGIGDSVGGASGEIDLSNAQAKIRTNGQIVKFLGASGNEADFAARARRRLKVPTVSSMSPISKS